MAKATDEVLARLQAEEADIDRASLALVKDSALAKPRRRRENDDAVERVARPLRRPLRPTEEEDG